MRDRERERERVAFIIDPMACYFVDAFIYVGVSGPLIQYLKTKRYSALVQDYCLYEPVPQ